MTRRGRWGDGEGDTIGTETLFLISSALIILVMILWMYFNLSITHSELITITKEWHILHVLDWNHMYSALWPVLYFCHAWKNTEEWNRGNLHKISHHFSFFPFIYLPEYKLNKSKCYLPLRKTKWRRTNDKHHACLINTYCPWVLTLCLTLLFINHCNKPWRQVLLLSLF